MLEIWGRANSSNVQKVLWAAAELGLPYTRHDVGGAFGGNRAPEYLALNPNGLVPTLRDGTLVLWESNAILRYLGARYGTGTLWPTDPVERAIGDRWMDWQLTTFAPAMLPIFWQLIRTPEPQRDMQVVETARQATADLLLSRLEPVLAKQDWLGGARFTVADIPLAVMIYRWMVLPIERPAMPALEAWYHRLQDRPAFVQEAMVKLT